MTVEEAHERLTAVFRDIFDDPALVIADSDDANKIPAWDSLTHVTLISAVEEEFDVQFSTTAIVEVANVGDIKRLLLSGSSAD